MGSLGLVGFVRLGVSEPEDCSLELGEPIGSSAQEWRMDALSPRARRIGRCWRNICHIERSLLALRPLPSLSQLNKRKAWGRTLIL